MNGRRAVIGLCVLCALAISAVAAQAASAAGTTAYTEKSATAVPNGETTELQGSGAKSLLKSVSSGVVLTLESQKLSGTGTMVNSESTEMFASGTGTIVYEEVTVAAPAGKGCVVKGGKVTTNALTATTLAQGSFLKFTPTSGTVFAAFTVEGCSTAALNKEYKAEGSVKGVPTGTSTVFTHTATTEQGTLTLGGQKAGLEGTLKLAGRKSGTTGAFTPLEAK